jgi:hypothetical protein
LATDAEALAALARRVEVEEEGETRARVRRERERERLILRDSKRALEGVASGEVLGAAGGPEEVDGRRRC